MLPPEFITVLFNALFYCSTLALQNKMRHVYFQKCFCVIPVKLMDKQREMSLILTEE